MFYEKCSKYYSFAVQHCFAGKPKKKPLKKSSNSGWQRNKQNPGKISNWDSTVHFLDNMMCAFCVSSTMNLELICCFHCHWRISRLRLDLKQKATLAPSPHQASASALNSLELNCMENMTHKVCFNFFWEEKTNKCLPLFLAAAAYYGKAFSFQCCSFHAIDSRVLCYYSVMVSWWQHEATDGGVVFQYKSIYMNFSGISKKKSKSSLFAKVAKN